MLKLYLRLVCPLVLLSLSVAEPAQQPPDLQVGVAAHAFDHLGALGEQAQAALASGATVLYVTGVGALGYQGLPPVQDLRRQEETARNYLTNAKRSGLRLALGYLCATSIVKLKSFDENWTGEFRAQFRARPAEWRQVDRHGHPLPSWYGGDYEPACMNNPDWRAYERYMVRLQLESGCDGIFFDNPTVHPQGCYCEYCMEGFDRLLAQEARLSSTDFPASPRSLLELRKYAETHVAIFRRFRCTIGRDFLAAMRDYARSIRPTALITANNSLNSADALYSQCRSYAYNIYEMSRAEDFVVVEDMSSQPRLLANGKTVEYGPTYKQLRALSHERPIAAATLAEADYHTPPHLVRLALAEAAANGASHLWWPTWPEDQRQRMISLVRPQVEFLRNHAELLNGARMKSDVSLFLPFRKWVESESCRTSALASELSRANLQYEVICEDQLPKPGNSAAHKHANVNAQNWNSSIRQDLRVLLAASLSDFTPDERAALDEFFSAHGSGAILSADHTNWLDHVRQAVDQPSITLRGPSTVRAAIWDQPKRTIVHLLNLDVQRLSSFEDRVTPARDLRLTIRVRSAKVRSCRALTADSDGTAGAQKFSILKHGPDAFLETTLPCLAIATILVIE